MASKIAKDDVRIAIDVSLDYASKLSRDNPEATAEIAALGHAQGSLLRLLDNLTGLYNPLERDKMKSKIAKDDVQVAIDVCSDYAAELHRDDPQATSEISMLTEAQVSLLGLLDTLKGNHGETADDDDIIKAMLKSKIADNDSVDILKRK